ncbi:MAG: radical SAM protein [Thermoprotei archaeon]|nr:MAG: radical SAM protein [Thermoprotei archaeon]
MVRYARITVRQALSRSRLPDLDYALNPYAGCAHACVYCYARAYTRYREVAENWGEVVYVKRNLVELLEREVRVRRPGVVGVSTITDPYQPVEAEEELTRRCIELLSRKGFKVSIQTKSPLVTRDLDVMEARPEAFDVGFTITTMNEAVARIMEPRAPLPAARARAVEEVAKRGVKTWIFLGPILPGLNDDRDSIARVIEIAQRTGSKLYYDYLRVGEALRRSKLLRPEVYQLALKAKSASWRRHIERVILEECDRRGVCCEPEHEHEEKLERSISLEDFM